MDAKFDLKDMLEACKEERRIARRAAYEDAASIADAEMRGYDIYEESEAYNAANACRNLILIRLAELEAQDGTE